MKVPDPGRTTLYRFFNLLGDLLYIGITGKIPVRLGQHSDTKPWFAEIASITVEHHPTRAVALAAEKAAIKAERPKYNVVHNHGRRSKAVDRLPGRWTFMSRRSGMKHVVDLWLYPELDCSAMVDDVCYLSGEGQVEEYVEYLERNYPEWLEADAVPIIWTVAGGGIYENAPYQAGDFGRGGGREDFLSYFTWPYDGQTGERIDFFKLPIRYRFPEFSEALGWDPSPLQPTCPLRSVLASRDGIEPEPPRPQGKYSPVTFALPAAGWER